MNVPADKRTVFDRHGNAICLTQDGMDELALVCNASAGVHPSLSHRPSLSAMDGADTHAAATAMSPDALANEFALALLMPARDYRAVFAQNTVDGVTDTAAIAAHFHVTVSDAATRGVSLGLLRW